MVIKVISAPVSVGEQERFIDELKKLSPAFAGGAYDGSFGREDRTKLIVSGKSAANTALKALIAAGWKITGTWSVNPALARDFPILTKDGLWPVRVQISPLGATFYAPDNDQTGNDSTFKTALTRMAKAIMPGKIEVDLRNGQASWRVYGGRAGGKMLQKIVQKAEAVGFKSASFFGSSHPAGDWVSGDETYLHPEGWILQTGSTYGSTAQNNSFWAKLSVDYRRGENPEAQKNLPQPGECVRYGTDNGDRVGMVTKIRNSRLLVSRDGSEQWVDAGNLKWLPKKGDTITYKKPAAQGKVYTGTVKGLSPGYVVVELSIGTEKFTDYPHFVNLQEVNGKPWDWAK